MAWPTAVTTTGMDADTDTLPRSDILDLATKFNALIAMRGVASGVCDLDGSGLVPNARLNATLAALAGLSTSAGLVEQTGTNTFTKRAISANIKSFLDAADNAAARTALGLATVAQDEAEAGVATTERAWTAARVAQAIAALAAAGLGDGQTWQNMTASRATNTEYTNSTGKPIMVYLMGIWGLSGTVVIDTLAMALNTTQNAGETFVVPNGSTYKVTNWTGTTSAIKWMELR